MTSGEGDYPGSGGNLNTVYAGDGYFDERDPFRANPADEGYTFGKFPAGSLATGAEFQDFRISDSDAFNNLRGIAKTSFPFDPFPLQDTPNNMPATSLRDEFQQSDLAGVSSLMPGKFAYNIDGGTQMSQQILNEFNAGTSSFNSLPGAKSVYASENFDRTRLNGANTAGYNEQVGEGIDTSNLVDQFKASYSQQGVNDVPLAPFAKTYFNFGSGQVDYGFYEPGSDKASEDIIRAYHAILPEGQLAGTKKDLMPVFSGIAQEAVEQRPILQSLGKIKNTLYLGGLTELPDLLKISPVDALTSGSNAPADIVQSGGELAAALQVLGGYHDRSSLKSGNAYGTPLHDNQMLSDHGAQGMPQDFYDYLRTDAQEPLLFTNKDYSYTANERDILMQ